MFLESRKKRMKRKAWSPYKEMVINYVRNHPGCCKWDIASYCTRNPLRCPSKQYYIVNTALKHGWIKGHFNGRQWELFAIDYEKDTLLPEGKIRFTSEGGFYIEPSPN